MHKGGTHVGRGRRCLPTWSQEWEETDSLALPIQVCHPQPLEPSLHPGAPVTPQSPAAPQDDPGAAGHPQVPGQ